MAKIKEFKGLRPPVDLVSKIAELPYDVCSSKEAKEKAGDNKLNFFHISKPEIDLPEDTDPYDEKVYLKGAENLNSFISEGYFREDSQEKLYFYTLIMNGREQSGLVTCVSIDDYLNDIVKKHEFTREEKENDRIRHLDVLNAQTGLVFLLYRENGSKKDLWRKALSISPEYDFTADDGIRHIFRLINDPVLINEFRNAFADEVLYIADGHHRAASAVKNGVSRRERNANHNGSEEYNYFLSVIFPHDHLQILPYNRVLADLNGMDSDAVLEKIGKKFRIDKNGQKNPVSSGSFCMYLENSWYTVTADFEIPSDAVNSLDVSLLQNFILDPVFDIKDPRKSKRIDFIGGIRGTEELEKLVNSGAYKIAFSMFPTSVIDLINVSDSGHVMPPKSTWFEPKLRSGIILHKI
ncbi:MAG: DUF1015 domain-containing protein [Spirochaetes bacterium]|nr:DUF1015 domain-containing protein [Spirochaetota bacterium]